MSNLQPNCCLKFYFQKVDQHAGGRWLIHAPNAARTISCKAWNSSAEYPSWARCDIKGSVSNVLNPIFWKVQGQKHPGRWGIVEHQLSCIKVLLKTNTKGHKQPGIRLLSKSKTQLVNQRKQNPRTPQKYNPIEHDGVQLRQYWHSRCVYIYIYNNSYKKCTYIYINRASGREPRSSGGNASSNTQVSALVPRPVVNGMERMCQRHGSDQTPTLLFDSKNRVNQFI